MVAHARTVSDLGHPIRIPLAIAAMAGLLLLTLVGPAMTMVGGAESGAGNVLRQAGYAIVFLIIVIAMRPLKHPERLAVVPVFFWIALAWCWLSLSWAIAPEIAVRRLILTTIIIWSVFAIVRQLGVERSLLFVRWALIAVLLANFAAVLLYPQLGIHQALGDEASLVGNWRGIMGHKNAAGLTCAITILFFVFDRRNMHLAIALAVVAFSIIFLWFSASKTSLGLSLGAIVFGYLIPRYVTPRSRGFLQLRYTRFVVGTLCFIGLFPLIHFSVQSDAFLSFISDPSRLTGRTSIWSAMVKYYLSSPVFSAGYGSFWNIDAVSPILRFGQGWITTLSEGHNGFLDLLVTIGLPGLVVVLMATLVAPLILILAEPRLSTATQMLVVATMLFCIAHNLTESSLFDRDSIGWVFMLFVLAILTKGEFSEEKSSDSKSLSRFNTRSSDTARDMNRAAMQRLNIDADRRQFKKSNVTRRR